MFSFEKLNLIKYLKPVEYIQKKTHIWHLCSEVARFSVASTPREVIKFRYVNLAPGMPLCEQFKMVQRNSEAVTSWPPQRGCHIVALLGGLSLELSGMPRVVDWAKAQIKAM